MARLTDRDVTQLVERLSGQAGHAPKSSGQRATVDRSPTPTADVEHVRDRLRGLSADGTLGPLLTQRLAVYLGKPVRCTSGSAAGLSNDGPLYVAHGQGLQVWIRLDALLASAIADAMIGGEGDAPKVGYSAKVARVATGAATEMVKIIAQALHLSGLPLAVADQKPQGDFVAIAGGGLTVAMHDYSWEAGVSTSIDLTPEKTAPPAGVHSPRRQTPPTQSAGGIDVALERARRRLEELLAKPVRFEGAKNETLPTPRMPQGLLRISLSSRGGGAIVLALSRQTETALLATALDANVTHEGGVLLETGAEVILREALYAFAEELSGTPDELHHIVCLSDSAVLAELPHRSVEHRIECGTYSGTLHWLVPEQMLRQRTSTATSLATEKH